MILDAKDQLVGRFAVKVAKAAILGEEIHIVNCEKACISGNPEFTIAKFTRFKDMGTPTKGPFFPKQSHMIVKRMIRGMIPYKKARGKEALARIKCYIGVPKEFEGKPTVQFEEASVDKLPVIKYVAIGKIAQVMGGNK